MNPKLAALLYSTCNCYIIPKMKYANIGHVYMTRKFRALSTILIDYAHPSILFPKQEVSNTLLYLVPPGSIAVFISSLLILSALVPDYFDGSIETV